MTIYKFREVKQCPKCTQSRFHTNPDDGTIIDFFDSRYQSTGFIMVSCCHCGYTFQEQTADAEPKPEPEFFMNQELFKKIAKVNPGAARDLQVAAALPAWRERVDFNPDAKIVTALMKWGLTRQGHDYWSKIHLDVEALSEPKFFMNRDLFEKIKNIDPNAADYLERSQGSQSWRGAVRFKPEADSVMGLLRWSDTDQGASYWNLIDDLIKAGVKRP